MHTVVVKYKMRMKMYGGLLACDKLLYLTMCQNRGFHLGIFGGSARLDYTYVNEFYKHKYDNVVKKWI